MKIGRHRCLPGLLALLALSFVFLHASAQQVIENIPYTNGPGAAQSGDLYKPAGAGPFPAIVYIHGGSWRSGNKSTLRRLATDLAAQGYAGFSIDYDLHPHSFPLSWQQARTAVQFVRQHAGEYHIDPDKIMVAGTSSGGELAALIALAPQGPQTPLPTTAPNATPATVSAAIILNGVFDLSSSVGVIKRYLGGDCSAEQAVCTDASPLHHVAAGAPPFFVGHGTEDRTVAYGEAQAFVAALQGEHVPVMFYSAAGGPHMYWDKKEFYAANLAAVEAFLTGVMHPAQPPQ